jgi:hypothetical protein
LGTITEFNGKKPIDIRLKKQIEAHFDYRFQHDKLIAFRNVDDLSIFDQLPEEVQQTMYVEFLFKDFLEEFKRLFTFNNVDCPNQPAFFSYVDHHYRGFMLNLLSCLEPREEKANKILLNELDEVNEVFFFTNGMCETGFEINRI